MKLSLIETTHRDLPFLDLTPFKMFHKRGEVQKSDKSMVSFWSNLTCKEAPSDFKDILREGHFVNYVTPSD